MNIREVNIFTRRFKGLNQILIDAVSTLSLCTGQDNYNYSISQCHNIKDYSEVFAVRVSGRYEPTQLNENKLVDIKTKSRVYRGNVRVVNAMSAQTQLVYYKMHCSEVNQAFCLDIGNE